jgi:hypothetical protein
VYLRLSFKPWFIDPLGERVDVRYANDSCAMFVPRTPGFYKIYIGDLHGPIFGSPFFVNIHEEKHPSSARKADRIFVESSGIRDTIVNEESKFLIRNKDDEIEVLVKGSHFLFLVLRNYCF